MVSNKIKKEVKVESSFRDPSGFLYRKNGALLRQINKNYQQHYDKLINSRLYKQLVKLHLLIEHKEEDFSKKLNNSAFKVIRPSVIEFISYPYEWCFSQLKDAALATLKIQKTALEYGMSLKDASAYNIQFYNGLPILIDTLSFEKYEEGKPWVAYRQFCQHFLAPLALAAYSDIRLIQLLRIYIDGIPLEFTNLLLPKKTLFNAGLLTHLHLHAKAQKKYQNAKTRKRENAKTRLSKQNLIALIDNLYNTVSALKWKRSITEWGEYYEYTNYSKKAFNHKKDLVEKYLKFSKANSVWDLGANTGEFSRIASDKNIYTIAFDIDPNAIEKNYQVLKSKKEKNILPLLMDFTNPSPSQGWAHSERDSLINRGPSDTIMALALIHHLAISNNLPFRNIAEFFAKLCKFLIIEFVPKQDSQAQKLLSTRKDIFNHYTQEGFEKEFGRFFKIIKKENIKDSKRTLYLLG